MKTKEHSLRFRMCLHMALLFISVSVPAQSNLNLSFENWTIMSFMGPTPVGWLAFNASQQTLNPQQGSSYARVSNSNIQDGLLMISATTGTAGSFKGGVPFSGNITAVTGFYKSSGVGTGDTLGMQALVSKSGSLTGFGSFQVLNNKATWTSFSVPVMYFGPMAVDTLYFIATSGKMSNGPRNSMTATLDIDNISLSTITGIDEGSIGTAFLVYPNPASEKINIFSKDERASLIRITDMNGKVVEEVTMKEAMTSIDLNAYAENIYFYTILDKEGAPLLSNKFAVKK